MKGNQARILLTLLQLIFYLNYRFLFLLFHSLIYYTTYQVVFTLFMIINSRLFLRFAFSGGAQTIQGHRPPAFSDKSQGRYAGALFTAASKTSALQTVAQDLTHLRAVIKASEPFRQVIKNSAVRKSKQKQIFGSFAPSAYCELTVRFIHTVIDSGRLAEVQKIIETYLKYCKVLNNEQDIRVISAVELNQNQKTQVVASLKKNKPGVMFKITYEIDADILGGVQIYAGSQFLDCSLRSRLDRLKSELSKIA